MVRFPGSNCETETLTAVTASGGEAFALDHRSDNLQGARAVIIQGGFSYGDYLRSGAIARLAPVMDPIRVHAKQGGVVIGICNGFQVLCEAGLLPGALLHNHENRFVARPIDIRIERNTTACTSEFEIGEVVRIPMAHGEGRYVADTDTLDRLETEHLVVLRYVAAGGSDLPHNPNGSERDIAGICNREGNVVGFMPHPERHADRRLGPAPGSRFFDSLIAGLSHPAVA